MHITAVLVECRERGEKVSYWALRESLWTSSSRFNCISNAAPLLLLQTNAMHRLWKQLHQAADALHKSINSSACQTSQAELLSRGRSIINKLISVDPGCLPRNYSVASVYPYLAEGGCFPSSEAAWQPCLKRIRSHYTQHFLPYEHGGGQNDAFWPAAAKNRAPWHLNVFSSDT